jgi:hypothetical protein
MKAATAAVVRHRANLASLGMSSCIQYGIYTMLVCHIIHIRRHVWNIFPQMRANHWRLVSSRQRLRGFAGLTSTKLTREKSLAVPTQLFASELLHQFGIESTDFVTEVLWLHRFHLISWVLRSLRQRLGDRQSCIPATYDTPFSSATES